MMVKFEHRHYCCFLKQTVAGRGQPTAVQDPPPPFQNFCPIIFDRHIMMSRGVVSYPSAISEKSN